MELPALYTSTCARDGSSAFAADRVELSMDVYNLTNANTTYNVRTGTGLDEHPGRRRSERAADAHRDVPVADRRLGPRIIRFNIDVLVRGEIVRV